MKPKDPLWKEYNAIVNSVTRASKELTEKENQSLVAGRENEISPHDDIEHQQCIDIQSDQKF